MAHTIAALRQSYWPADGSRPLIEKTEGQVLQEAARRAPDTPALVEKLPPAWASLTGAGSTQRRWTYAGLHQDAVACAHWLLQRFAPGQRICVWAPNVPEWVVLQYGASLAGMVLVTANPALRAQELDYVLRQSGASALFHVDRFRGSDMAAMAGALARPGLAVVSFTGWLAQVRVCPAGAALPAVDPRGPAQIQYTSGTTGDPKGALLHHMGLVTNASYVAARAEQGREVYVCPMPLFHTAGSVMSVLGCVNTLSTLVLVAVFDPDLVLQAIEDERGTRVGAVPTMLLAMLEQRKAGHYDISSLKLAMSGGAPVPVALTERVRDELGCDLVTVFGQTELSPIVCQTSPRDSMEDKASTAGRPLWNVEVRIADLDGAVLPIGQEGEIQARGYQTMLGYFGQPEATRQTLLSDGWLRTGDFGVMDERGYCKVTGRLKDMIIRGGENIYPAQVETVLMKHPAVADVAVFGMPDAHWGEQVAAAVRLHPDAAPCTAEQLRQHCRQHIAPHKAPQHWFVCDAFPLTGSGKVQKFRLKALAQKDALRRL
ncbi:AMP-binding protein [Alicycliphilus denitrificans]|uniref:Long-chain fatty acid--CoA ligase n=1 Tax=Alicycliphilus denitrificans TaxID=179636 RepID=A0A3R7EEY6_9BURK|nr:AMP-binding protein [Alicycliphilus denitrificans]RKJ97325.1 long-chain fatty acid--CoA ligase [Alicycliphilus denitrificans]